MRAAITPCILDLETNILNDSIGNNKALSFSPMNGIVLGLFKWEDSGVVRKNFIGTGDEPPGTPLTESNRYVVADVLSKCDVLVGHNIKFDLLYLRKFYNELYLEWLNRGGTVWDTQIIEYLLSGQSKLYPTLDYVSEKYGGTLKPDAIKEYWKKGIDTHKIPKNELMNYLMGDVDNTELVFYAQAEEVDRANMYALVTTQMDALLALVEMEYNGMKFDSYSAYRKMTDLIVLRDKSDKYIRDQLKYYLPDNMKAEVSPNSPQQLSVYFFGGNIKCVRDTPVLDSMGKKVIYKSGIKKGKVKTKKQIYEDTLGGICSHPTSITGASGYYSTDDDALREIIKSSPPGGSASELAKALIEYRALDKDISTYYEGMIKLVCPDGLIHPNFNQCATATGRLSSSSPNAQNVSGKKDE